MMFRHFWKHNVWSTSCRAIKVYPCVLQHTYPKLSFSNGATDTNVNNDDGGGNAQESKAKSKIQKKSWRQEMSSLWKSVGMNNRQISYMISLGESRGLLRNRNMISRRIATFREIFPDINDCHRVFFIMPSLLNDENVNINVKTIKNALLRHKILSQCSNINIDEIISKYPFILSKSPHFINENISNMYQLFFQSHLKNVNRNKKDLNSNSNSNSDGYHSDVYSINQFSLMILNDPSIICFDCNKSIFVKYKMIKEHFEKRMEMEICHYLSNLIKKESNTHNNANTNTMQNEIDNENQTGDSDSNDADNDDNDANDTPGESRRRRKRQRQTQRQKRKQTQTVFPGLELDLSFLNNYNFKFEHLSKEKIIQYLQDYRNINKDEIYVNRNFNINEIMDKEKILKIISSEKDEMIWTIVRNVKQILSESDWYHFARLEYMTKLTSYDSDNIENNQILFVNKSKLAINRIFELERSRMFKKFPEYSHFIKQRLVFDANCDPAKLQSLEDETDLEEAMGELISMENEPYTKETDDKDDSDSESDNQANSSEDDDSE